MDYFVEFVVGDQYFGFVVLQYEGDGFGVEVYVEGVQYCVDYWYVIVCFEYFGDVWQYYCYCVVLVDVVFGQG